MLILETILDYKNWLKKFGFNKKIGFIPTMGALHEGHLSLLNKARQENEIVVLSIFVNPLQFGENEDFSKYPRTFQDDIEIAKKANVDVIFAPAVTEIYPTKQNVFVDVQNITSGLCGASRPGHFQGVATIVAKLFNILKPQVAYFGQKDYQQFLVIKRMTEQLGFDVKLEMCEIIRENDGLAMSSRNKYLNQLERQQAVCLSQALRFVKNSIESGEISDANSIKNEIEKIIIKNTLAKIDYIFVGDSKNLEPLQDLKNQKNILLALAVYIGKTRLIDNILIHIN